MTVEPTTVDAGCPERVHELDAESLALFAGKGVQPGKTTHQSGANNAVKVRRVLQITRDFATVPFEKLRILDLACGEGVYAIEAGLRGAAVLGIDARNDRMQFGECAAARLGLSNVRFEQRDVRAMRSETDGTFDVIYFLGILYHLDASDSCEVLRNLQQMCRGIVVIDTHIALRAKQRVEHQGRTYHGLRRAEHRPDDSTETRRSRLLSSIDNTWSFWFTRESLVRLLHDTGFSSVYECHVPAEPFKRPNRVTLVARRGDPVKISTYPWISGMTDDEIERSLDALQRPRRLSGKVRLKWRRIRRQLGFETAS